MIASRGNMCRLASFLEFKVITLRFCRAQKDWQPLIEAMPEPERHWVTTLFEVRKIQSEQVDRAGRHFSEVQGE